MHAEIGDQLVVESTADGLTRRDGEIVGLRHADGSPPYEVRWSDTGEVTLVFPGPDAHVRHLEHARADRSAETELGNGTRQDPVVAPSSRSPRPGDVGRRIATARERRGLTREKAAALAGMAPGYLAYLEEHPADPTEASLIRLADALGTGVGSLRGADADLPTGRGRALARPVLRELGLDECRARLSTHGVGRVSVVTPEGPAVVPVNYEVVDEEIAFRTAPGSPAAAAVGKEVAFEVDHVDEAMSQGWSVLGVGPARAVTEPEAVDRLASLAHTTPWAGGAREMWVSIRPARLTGRRIDSA